MFLQHFFTGDDNPASENSSNHTSKLDPGEPIKEDMNDMPMNDCQFQSSFEPSSNYSSYPVYKIDDGERLVAVPYPEFTDVVENTCMFELMGLYEPHTDSTNFK